MITAAIKAKVEAKLNVAVWMLNRVTFKSVGNQQLLGIHLVHVKRLKGCI